LPLADSMVLAVNEEYVDMDAQLTLSANDEVALIPPLSGG
jgi:molybdopterin converting factor small subunit